MEVIQNNQSTTTAPSDIDSRSRIVGPVVGKTYSLYGQDATSDGYYEEVDALLDDSLRRWPDEAALLHEFAQVSTSARRLKRASRVDNSPVQFVCSEGERRLAPYLLDIDAHKASLSLINRFSRTMTMTREQYLVCVVEIELRNRINGGVFGKCSEKLAFLPHCLHDLDATCEAKPHGLDSVCMCCSGSCYINEVSRLLRRNRVRPYIWMNANLSRLLRTKAKAPDAIGVLGIACIPELAAGMRLCARAGVPVVGLPLDANRCSRWLGNFHQNTMNLRRLESLVAGSHDQ
jgi:hypothetical protein